MKSWSRCISMATLAVASSLVALSCGNSVFSAVSDEASSSAAVSSRSVFVVDGSFSVLQYNVAGLPALLSSSDPEENTALISPLLNDYDIVSVAEDFAYHDVLISSVTSPYLTETSGNVPFGDGMNIIAKYPFGDLDREKWEDSSGFITNGADQMTPKGFAYVQFTLAPGVYVDYYTLHADADCDDGSLDARNSNMTQLAEYIETYSKGHAVVVAGDTNSRYTRSGDHFETLLVERCGLTDAWIELVRDGDVPEDADDDPLMDTTDRNGAGFEVVDKIFYRSGGGVKLQAAAYRLEDEKFVDADGEQLSDHYPITVSFDYDVVDDVAMGELWGGPGGIAFNCLGESAPLESVPVSFTIRGGNRVDAVAVAYSDGTTLSWGGTGGTAKTLTLGTGEYVTQAVAYKNKYNGQNRIFYLELTTNLGRTISGGKKSGTAKTLSVADGWYVAGFFGRAEANVDKIGLVSRPVE